jgi:hypothetical protein
MELKDATGAFFRAVDACQDCGHRPTVIEMCGRHTEEARALGIGDTYHYRHEGHTDWAVVDDLLGRGTR